MGFGIAATTASLRVRAGKHYISDVIVGSVFGIGFPPMQGGAIQYVNGYEAADGSIGVAAFAARATQLAATYGERFAPPASLVEKAASGASFE